MPRPPGACKVWLFNFTSSKLGLLCWVFPALYWVVGTFEATPAGLCHLEGVPRAPSLLRQQPLALVPVQWQQAPFLLPAFELSHDELACPIDSWDSSPVQPAPGACEGLSSFLCASGSALVSIPGTQSCGWGSLLGRSCPGLEEACLSRALGRRNGEQGPA